MSDNPSEIAAIMRGRIIDAFGREWELYEAKANSTWLPVDNPSADPESWVKVSGNYGPVRLGSS